MQDLNGKYHYVYSCDLDANIQIKIGTLEGKRERPGPLEIIDDPMLHFSGLCEDECSDLYVICQVYADGRSLALPTSTSYKSFSKRWNWNEWLTLPVKYCDLPRNASLALTIWDIYGPRDAKPIGGSTIALFGEHGTFRQGMHDLRVWPHVEADGHQQTTTPGTTSGKEDEMDRLAKLTKIYRDGHMLKIDWLDRLTFREIEQINEQQKRNSNFMYLMVEFPSIHFDATEYAVVYYEMGGDEVIQSRMYAELVTVPDPECMQENLVESKHHKLARSLRSGPTDKDLKPNAAVRDQLNVIVSYPPTKSLSSEEQDLIWKFRFYLSSQKKALTKFLKSVNWNVTQEVKQALDMLPKWTPMDVEDALELLTPTFTHSTVRKYAVIRLNQASDKDLLMYLLQLVQALKYENIQEIIDETERLEALEKSRNASRKLGSVVHSQPDQEYMESGSDSMSAGSDAAADSLLQLPESVAPEYLEESILDAMEEDGVHPPAPLAPPAPQDMDLVTFLIHRACNDSTLANYFAWYVLVECNQNAQKEEEETNTMHKLYFAVLRRFSLTLKNSGNPEMKIRCDSIQAQQGFMIKLTEAVKIVARESANRKKKMEKLQAVMRDPDVLKFNFTSFPAIPLPLDPKVTVTGIDADKCYLFKSALMPCRLHFLTTDGNEYVTMYKHGDDLRQDQLIIQMITLMDKLLMGENLDLKLTPYKVLATSPTAGFVQFIESVAVAEVLEKEGTIKAFLRNCGPSDSAPHGINPEIMDNYIRSCAGYSVITYLLGVGDRHFDNLLLTYTGKLFHIDFGYILGRDPKPMPPPMRISREMADAMGGTESEQFTDFRKLCYTAFLALRRNSNLILNLFSLMVDASVPDIALEPDKTVKKVQDKFCLEYSDEEAVQYMETIINHSLDARFAGFFEQVHKLAQYWRK